jgi:hypothetical protein
MKPFVKRWLALGANRRRVGTSRQSSRCKLAVETLERRDLPSTLYLVPNGVPHDATHFHTFQNAYQAAQNGDIIQVEPGASVASVGPGAQGSRVAGGAQGTASITIANPDIRASEWIQIKGGGGGAEVSLVVAAQPGGSGTVTLTLIADLAFDHSGSGATVTALGKLGFVKQITLQGDPADAQATVASPVELPSGVANITFDNLDFTSVKGLTIDGGHQSITVENSTFPYLSLNPGPGNAYDVVAGNTLTGFVAVNGDSAGQTADWVHDNTFTGGATLWMINNAGSALANNTFSTDAPASDAVVNIINCPGIAIADNTFSVTNAGSSTTELLLWQVTGYAQTLDAAVWDNVFNTAGKGVGLEIWANAPLQAVVQGNDFRHNGCGIYLNGDGTDLGIVDLGGGPLGSLGQNNFSTFTAAAAARGHFAISLHNTAFTDHVFAEDNIWAVSDPETVVKDGYNNNQVPDAVYGGGTTGTGQLLFSLVITMSPTATGTTQQSAPGSADQLAEGVPDPALAADLVVLEG